MTEHGPVPMVRGERVWLRPSERTDLDIFLRWFNDAEMTRFLSQRAPIGSTGEERWLEDVLQRHGKDSYHFVICRLDDDRPIGTAALFDVDHLNGSAEFGIAIGEKQLWGQGYGTDALNAIVDFGFGELRLHRISLYCYAFNPRGRRSYEKAGFVVEGTLRGAHFQEGEYHDVLLMSLLRDEWAALPRREARRRSEPADGASGGTPAAPTVASARDSLRRE